VAETPKGRRRVSRREEKAVLKEIMTLAQQYKQPVTTAVRTGPSPDDAILAAMKENRYDFAVVGVSRRIGEDLAFGTTAARILAKSTTPVLLIAT
jgi:nucleotide-binding universal stress UspA family protein